MLLTQEILIYLFLKSLFEESVHYIIVQKTSLFKTIQLILDKP